MQQNLIKALDGALLILHFISILSERKKANNLKDKFDKSSTIPEGFHDLADIYGSFLGYVSFALFAIHVACI